MIAYIYILRFALFISVFLPLYFLLTRLCPHMNTYTTECARTFWCARFHSHKLRTQTLIERPRGIQNLTTPVNAVTVICFLVALAVVSHSVTRYCASLPAGCNPSPLLHTSLATTHTTHPLLHTVTRYYTHPHPLLQCNCTPPPPSLSITYHQGMQPP